MQDETPIPCGIEDFVELSRHILAQNASLRFQAGGYSMYPTIRHGDVILVEPTDQVKVGDVVLFRTIDNRVIVHRVIGKIFKDGQPIFQTKGDACQRYDRTTWSDQLLGRVVCVEKIKGGKEKAVRLDSLPGRWISWLWARFPLCSYWAHRFLIRVNRRVMRLLTVEEPKSQNANKETSMPSSA